MISRRMATAILTFASLAAPVGVAVGQSASNVISGYTQPSERRTQSFESAGVILEVLVKEGTAVKEGDLLMRQDDRMDRQELEVRRIDAESTIEIDSAVKEFELRKVQYERKASAPQGVGFSAAEVEEAKIAMELAELKIAEARQKNLQAKAVYERQKVKVEVMSLPSRIDGVVEKISVDAGEMADPQKPEGAISVVKTDPLWVELPLMTTVQAARLRAGQELDVRYPGDGADAAWRKAKVLYVSPVADARSGTQAVRLELPNPDNRAAGLDVDVRLPDGVAEGSDAPERAAAAGGND